MAQDGCRIWYDNGIHVGSDWVEQIAAHLDGGTICVVAISESYSCSHNCRNELNLALECQKPLIGIVLEEFQMPLGLRLQLGTIQYLKHYELRDELFSRLYETEILHSCQDKKSPPIVRLSQLHQEEDIAHEEEAGMAGENPTVQLIEASGKPGIVFVDLSQTKAYCLHGSFIRLGRSSAKCDLVLPHHQEISNHHADIILEEKNCYLEDAKSLNGSFVNGTRLGKNERIHLTNPTCFKLAHDKFQLAFGALADFLMQQDKLLFLQNISTLEQCCILEREFILGRSYQWEDGTFSDPKVGRLHAKVIWEETGFFIQDLNCTNRTYVNDHKLKRGGKMPLRNEDTIRLGDTRLKCKMVSLEEKQLSHL